LTKRLAIAEIVDPDEQTNRDQVFFGATVAFINEQDIERRVRIVGVDEADLARGEVSLYSPIARALMRSRRGDTVWLQTPQGREAIEVLDISYT